jgi:GxxExxY protein
MGLYCVRQQPIEVFYKEHKIGDYFADLLIENSVIVELKAVETIIKEHEVQLVHYLKATDIEVGLLLNFGPKPQITRRVLTKEYKSKIEIEADKH